MRQRSNIQKIVFIMLLPITTCFICYYATQPIRHQIAASFSFLDMDSETVFHRYILDYEEIIPPGASQIQGLSGTIFGYDGPVWIRFRATNGFISELLSKNQKSFGYYSPIACSNFTKEYSRHSFTQDFPEKFEWWQPLEITSPVCYKAQGCSADDAKYLLIDPNSNIVYFYRTATCGLCPSGDGDRAIRKELSHCQQ